MTILALLAFVVACFNNIPVYFNDILLWDVDYLLTLNCI